MCETGMIRDKDGRLLAKVYAQRGEVSLVEAEANAKLFASAPELLEALKAIADGLTASGPADYKRDCFNALKHARQAIEKAQA